MSNPRHNAIAGIVHTQLPQRVSSKREVLTELFGANVFGDEAMRARLPRHAYEALRRTIDTGSALDPAIADMVANAMKEWALEHGATHFTHWFQPMTGLTAEKHDTFLHFSGNRLLLEFSGKELIRGEPDASSFPSGGIRSTFEARGYTAWDPTSPAFMREGINGATLCIPTAFCSWTGEALDKKTPMLRSTQVLSQNAVRLLRLLGHEKVQAVFPTAGAEQEFFLIDRRFFLARPDLVATGRTLMGARPPKGQELEDHYFGAIKPRILACIQEAEQELWKLGVPLKTRHNEVAPAQYEVAPIFERSPVASDHNMLTMEVLRDVATKHDLVCLLHEKPFQGINGSGKHNNWSLADDSGENLLDPGHTPGENARFMVFLTAVVRAVDVHADLLRASVARAGNDHRLGANEAPPAILSVYLGEELDYVCKGLMNGGASEEAPTRKGSMELGVNALPPLPRDTTDRNRTSPFAFTGNKFEFRAVGASQSIATPNMVLNAIVSESLGYMADEIEKAARGGDVKDAVQQVVQKTLKQHYRVVFNGNNYSEEWLRDAESRGLPNLRSTPETLKTLCSEKNITLLESQEVMSRNELTAHRNIMQESYAKAIAIEAQACLSMGGTMVLPAAVRQQQRLARSLADARTAIKGLHLEPQEQALRNLSEAINLLITSSAELQTLSEELESMQEEAEAAADFSHDRVIPAMDQVRKACDTLETMVDDDLWILPRYREMLFMH